MVAILPVREDVVAEAGVGGERVGGEREHAAVEERVQHADVQRLLVVGRCRLNAERCVLGHAHAVVGGQTALFERYAHHLVILSVL